MNDAPNIAVFCDFENVALGAKDAKYGAFDIDLVLQRLLDKGQIVVKKSYCDWGRYGQAKRPMHEASFELIEIPHVRYSGKNSADIRMVVDALDLCYTKPHVNVFALITGDSDFSPLVSKLRENGKKVIGVGVKNSSSDLLVDNCDEYIYYDDLVRLKRKPKRRAASKSSRQPDKADGKADAKVDGKVDAKADAKGNGKSGAKPDEAVDDKGEGKTGRGDKQEALDLVLDTVESLFQERDDQLWGSMVKQTLKRKRPHFSESYYGYRSFSELLEDAEREKLLEIEKDEKSGGYVIIDFGPEAD